MYTCGLVKTQEAYENALSRVFGELDRLEELLGKRAGARLGGHGKISLTDIQLLACLVRFDPVYLNLFKCFNRRIVSYPAFLGTHAVWLMKLEQRLSCLI